MAPGKNTSNRLSNTWNVRSNARKVPPKSGRKPVSSKKCQDPEFHQYQKLPGELKLMIWRAALHSRSTIQYAKIFNGGPVVAVGSLFTRDLVFGMPAKSEKSTWYDLEAIRDAGRSDRGAEEVIRKLPSRTSLCSVRARPGDGGNREAWQRMMSVDLDNEMVCLHFDSDYAIRWDYTRHELPPSICSLRRVGLDLHNLQGLDYTSDQKWRSIATLQCSCQHFVHKFLAFCPVKLTHLIALLRGAETIYILVRIGRLKDISDVGQRFLRNKAELAGKRRQTAGEMVKHALRRFQENARTHDLEIFEDHTTVFYEVRSGPARTLADYHKIWPVLESVEHNWRTTLGLDSSLVRRDFKLKVLVGMDWSAAAIKNVP